MTQDTTLSRILAAVRREWWLVALAVVVAVVVGALASGRTPTVYDASATIVVDSPNVSKIKGTPTPDDMMRAAAGLLAAELAKAGGMSAAEYASSVRVSTSGNPQNKLIVTVSSSDRASAERASAAIAVRLIDYVHEQIHLEIDKQQAVIDTTTKAIAAIEKDATDKLDAWSSSDITYKVWTMRTELLDLQQYLRVIQGVYSYPGGVDVSVKAARSARLTDLAGAGLVGLFVGLLLALAREAWVRSRARAATA